MTTANNFIVIHLIDGILARLHAVAPEWKRTNEGPNQWLYLAEPKIPFEIELVRQATDLSVPSFPPSERTLVKKKVVHYQLSDGSYTTEAPPPRLLNGQHLPQPKKDQVPYSVDFHALQSLSGLRAVLLVLMDSCGACARDPDYVGNLPMEDSLSVLRVMKTWTESDFVANAKYWKDWPLAKFLQNPFPPMPKSWRHSPTSVLFSGATGRYMNRLSTFPSDREESFHFYRAVFGIAQSKRGFAEVPRSFVLGAMQKHAKQLSSPPESDPDLRAARDFAETFLAGFRIPKVFKSLPSIEGSLRASVESSRERGGAREHLRRLAAASRGYSNESDVLLRMVHPDPSQVIEERGAPPLTPQEWRSLVKNYTPAVERQYILPHTVEDDIRDLIDREPSAEFLPTARVAEVLEPLKVRLITAMDAVRSHVARPVQQALWKFLRSSPVFRLIGEPVSESVLYDLVKSHRERGGGEDPFVSGDYSAATDGLDIRLSKVFMEAILDRLDIEDQPYRNEIASILYEQVIIYPSWTKIDPILQKNGQLMGSVLSFPILCMANLFAYIRSLPDADSVMDSRALIDALPVLINGDDILFRSSDSHYSRWMEEI
nr:MAG: RNA dependent RNA polymerase [Narnaviridae sp.]